MNHLVYPNEPLLSLIEYIQMNQADFREVVLLDILTWFFRIYFTPHQLYCSQFSHSP